MKRLYNHLIKHHLENYSQMVFLSGPRQVGKTTISKEILAHKKGIYLNWDFPKHKEIITNSLDKVIEENYANRLDNTSNLLVIDEIHKYKDWKNHIKGIYDIYHRDVNILITGSAKMDIYKKGGDSLMGRYFSYTIHPFSVAELASPSALKSENIISQPKKIDQDLFNALWKFGGFPEPLVKQEARFYNKWRKLRTQQMFREDIRNLENIKDVTQIELFASMLEKHSGQLLNYSAFAKHLRVSDNSIRRWLDMLESFYYCFRIIPWSNNISRSLLKEPKVYLWDWSNIEDAGARFENFIASHLFKMISFANESGLGDYGLYFIRTKDQKEVDFLVTKNDIPWFLVEAKYSGNQGISKSLVEFHNILRTNHAFQVTFDLPYIDKSCFDTDKPVIVPAQSFLSQLV